MRWNFELQKYHTFGACKLQEDGYAAWRLLRATRRGCAVRCREKQRSLERLFARAPAAAKAAAAAPVAGAKAKDESRTIFAAMDLAIVKADRRMKLGEVWFGELRESLVVSRVSGKLRLSAERLAIRYFKPTTTGELRFEYELDGHVSIEALYGTVGRTSHRRYDGLPSKLVGFDLSQVEYDAARELGARAC